MDRDISSINTGGRLTKGISSITIGVSIGSVEEGRISFSFTLANVMSSSITTKKTAIGGNNRSRNNSRSSRNSRGGNYGGSGGNNGRSNSSETSISSIAKSVVVGIGVSISTIEDRGISISISFTLAKIVDSTSSTGNRKVGGVHAGSRLAIDKGETGIAIDSQEEGGISFSISCSNQGRSKNKEFHFDDTALIV